MRRVGSERARKGGVYKRLFAIHRFVGLFVGVPLFVVCSSGTLAVLGHELDWLADPARRVESETVNWAAIGETLRSSFEHMHVRDVQAPVGPGHPVVALADSPRRQKQYVLLEPATGEITGRRNALSIQVYLRQFHKRFVAPYGLYLVTVLGFALLVSAVTGIVTYRRFWRHLLRLRTSRGRRVLFADLHRTFGVWSLLFSLVIAVTSIWYFAEKLAYDTAEVKVAPQPPTLPQARQAELGPSPRRLPLGAVAEAARSALPGFEVRRILPPDRIGDPVRVDGQTDAILVRDRASRVYLDPYSGRVLDTQRATHLSALQRWSDTADPLHFGTFGGLPTKLLWFVFGIVLSVGILAGPVLADLRRPRSTGAAGATGAARAKDGRPGRRLLVTSAALAFVSVAAAVAGTWFGYGRVLLQGHAPASRIAGPMKIGPWRLVISEHRTPGTDKAVYLLHPVEPRHAPWSEGILGSGSDRTSIDLGHLSARLAPAHADHLRVETPSGDTFDAPVEFREASSAEEAREMAGLDEDPIEPPGYVLAFVIGLLVLELGGVLAWLVLVLRGTRAAARRSGRSATRLPARLDPCA